VETVENAVAPTNQGLSVYQPRIESDNTCSGELRLSEALVFLEPTEKGRGGGPKPMSVADRIAHFWARVERSEGCWLWTGGLTPKGYGLVNCGRRPDGRQLNNYAHRVAYLLTKGPIPDHLEILHSCDVRNCVNPAHLRVDTHAENIEDARRQGKYAIAAARRWASKRDPVRVYVLREAMRGPKGTLTRLCAEHGLNYDSMKVALSRERRKAVTHG
jgi:hypothetical protein